MQGVSRTHLIEGANSRSPLTGILQTYDGQEQDTCDVYEYRASQSKQSPSPEPGHVVISVGAMRRKSYC